MQPNNSKRPTCRNKSKNRQRTEQQLERACSFLCVLDDHGDVQDVLDLSSQQIVVLVRSVKRKSIAE